MYYSKRIQIKVSQGGSRSGPGELQAGGSPVSPSLLCGWYARVQWWCVTIYTEYAWQLGSSCAQLSRVFLGLSCMNMLDHQCLTLNPRPFKGWTDNIKKINFFCGRRGWRLLLQRNSKGKAFKTESLDAQVPSIKWHRTLVQGSLQSNAVQVPS